MGGINMYLYKPSNMGWFILVLTTIHCNTLQYIAIHYIHIYNYTYILMYTWCIHVIIHQKASRVQVQLAGWRYPIPWLAGRPCISCISCVYLCLLLTERYCNAICYVFIGWFSYCRCPYCWSLLIVVDIHHWQLEVAIVICDICHWKIHNIPMILGFVVFALFDIVVAVTDALFPLWLSNRGVTPIFHHQ